MDSTGIVEVLQKNNRIKDACSTVSKYYCNSCTNCCKYLTVHADYDELKTISKKLNNKNLMNSMEKIDNEFIIKPPCLFLKKDGDCKVYDVRPGACEIYPFYLDQILIEEEGVVRNAPMLIISDMCECSKKLEKELEKEIDPDDEIILENMKLLYGNPMLEMIEKRAEENKKHKEEQERKLDVDLSNNLGKKIYVDSDMLIDLASRIKRNF